MNLSMKKRLLGTPAQQRAFVLSMMAAKILAEKRALRNKVA
jgi:hypothetical protein